MRILMRAGYEVRGLAELMRSRLAKPFSTLCMVGHGTGWVLDHEVREISRIVKKLGIPVRQISSRFGLPGEQCIHFAGAGILNDPDTMRRCARFSLDLYHGRPGQTEAFTERFENLRRFGDRIRRIRVSNSIMESAALEAGYPREKLHRIPIGINPEYFAPPTPAERAAVRKKLEIPEDAFVVGSFQKDGLGWGDGMEPKWEKAPDVFVEAVARAREEIPELLVLLTGPSRGFVREALAARGVPFVHHYLEEYREIGGCYQALDAYLISSREEGGPKAVLESLASGVPLVSTRCGQAADLIANGISGFLAPVEDGESLTEALVRVSRLGEDEAASLKGEGMRVAEANCYESQSTAWQRFLDGYVEIAK